MWTLILVTLVVSGAPTGGVGTTTTFLDFRDEASCQTGAAALATVDQVTIQRGVQISPAAIYRIVAKCVQR